MARVYSADGAELDENILRIDTRTGRYQYCKLNANGQCYVDQDDEVASAHGWATPPIRIEWARNRFLYSIEMRWHSFMVRIAVFRRTGQWPRRRKVKAIRSA